MKIIGLTGKKSSGKSTAADYLVRNWNHIEYAFADPLKKGLIEIFNIPHEHLYGTEQKKNEIIPFWNVSGRQLMQSVGSELFRDQLPKIMPEINNIWVQRMELSLINSKAEHIVISDVRFPDEAELIKKYGGLVISIERPHIQHSDSHQSETQNILADHIIKNLGTLNEFYKKIDNLLGDENYFYL